jgi:transposase
MATIIRKKKKGRPYYYAVESARVNGRPRIVWQKYLGTVQSIVARADPARPPAPKETVIFEAGGVAALLRMAQRLDLMALIDEVVPKRDQGPSVGQYLLLAAINRALAPCSKLAIGHWYEGTVLRRLWRHRASVFSSQRFWDHMDLVSEEAIETIQDRLLARVREVFGLDERLLLYDTTNFFTFIASTNSRNTLAQRGHSKAKRDNLRLVGLALLVTREFQIPLLHHTYEGNVPDVALFPEMARSMLVRYARIAGHNPDATLVFDKGNLSENGMEDLLASGLHFVAALPSRTHPELFHTPRAQLTAVESLPGTSALWAPIDLYGRSCRAVVAYTESFFTQQLLGVTTQLAKAQKKLLDLEKSLARWHDGKGRGKRPTLASVRRAVRSILSAQFMADLFRTDVTEDKGLPRLTYEVDHAALQSLTETQLGRTLLLTDHAHWTARETITTYRSLGVVEDAFKQMKNIDFLHWQPAWHWTDSKLRVHALYCVLGLLLASLARQTVARAGVDLSLPALLADLSAIREVAILYPPGTAGAHKDHIALSRMSPRQRKLAQILETATVLAG